MTARMLSAFLLVNAKGRFFGLSTGTFTHFLPSGPSAQLAMPKTQGSVAAEFKAADVEQAVREAQSKAPGYTYSGFCTKVKAADGAGYMVSFLGKRVVYFGRTAETHVEHFPK